MTPEQKSILFGYIWAVVYVFAAIFVALFFYKIGLSKKYTRKIVHILVGFEWYILYTFMGNSYHFFIVCAVFTVLLAVSHFAKLLPAMSSDGDNNPGTVYYGLSMTVMSFICMFVPSLMLPFGLGIFCTSLGDGFAGIVGQLITRKNPKLFRNKSLFGFATNLVVSFATALVFNVVFHSSMPVPLNVWQCLLIALVSASVELVGVFGLDNIFVTLSVAFLTWGISTWAGIWEYIVPIVALPSVIVLIVQKRALTPFATACALLLYAVVSIIFGNFGFLVMITFFIGALIIDKVKKIKQKKDDITKKEGCRDAIQVIANGLIPMAMALLYAYSLNPAFLVAYVASFAEAFADTAASGFGVFSSKTFDLFRFKPCKCGISGGVSVFGTVAGLVGSVLISLFLLWVNMPTNWLLVIISSVASFMGVLIDSALGSLVQIKYKCKSCGIITEKEYHCDKPTVKHSGVAFFDNDVVNVTSGAITAVIALLLTFVLL